MRISLSRAAFIAAASVVQAKDDVRYYLNGILIEKGPDNRPIIVATDGHRLVAAIDENGHCSDDMPDQVIIDFSAETLRTVRLVKNLDQPLTIDIQPNSITAGMIVTAAIGEYAGKQFDKDTVRALFNGCTLIDGTYPDWRRISKDSKEPATGWYNSGYVADFEKVARFLNAGSRKGMNGITLRSADATSAATVYFDGAPYAFGVLMPYRSEIENPQLPGWAAGPFKAAKAA